MPRFMLPLLAVSLLCYAVLQWLCTGCCDASHLVVELAPQHGN